MNGIIPIQTRRELDEAERLELEVKQEGEKRASDSFLISLIGDLRTKWEAAKRAKFNIEQRMLKSKRARRGEYEPTKLQAIQSLHGADYQPVYMMITETKCRAAESWIKDILLGHNSDPWDIEPTPIPDLPDEIEQQITEQVYQSIMEAAADEALAQGVPVDAQVVMQKIDEAMPLIKDKIHKQLKKLAKKAAERMKLQIADQFAEGGWADALSECIYDIVTYPLAIVKGPSLRKDVVRKGKYDPNSRRYQPELDKRVITKYERRSPFDIYPAPDSKGINDGYLFDHIRFTPKDLSDLIGVEGFDEKALRRCLSKYRDGGLKEWTMIESERASVENRDSTSIYDTEKIDCLEYHGSAQGKKLLEWGLTADEVPDAEKEYDICAWMIGDEIIGVHLNYDPMGKKPFSEAAFVEDPDSFWGKGVPELIESPQNIGNAIARAIVNNSAIASGPQVEIDKDRIEGTGTTTDLIPWKKWLTTNIRMQESPAIRFYQPQMQTEQLMRVYEFCLTLADLDSGVPRYEHADTKGAGATASGQSMMRTAAARGIKNVVNNIDNGIIRTTVERQYYYNLDFEDVELVGDMKCVAKGSSALVAKEQQAVRRTEFKVSLDDIDNQLLGLQGRKKLLQQSLDSLEIDLNLEDIEAEENALNAMTMGMGVNTEQYTNVPGMNAQNAASKKGIALDVAGNKTRGQQFALFNQGAR